MPNQSLVDLTERTATADTDLVHVNSGGTDYKQTKANFLQGDLYHVFDNTSLLTTQIDALPNMGTFFGRISSYGAQAVTGVPVNSNGDVFVQKFNGNYIVVDFRLIGNSDATYRKCKNGGTWESSWTQLPSRSEITSLNNSVVKYYDAPAVASVTIGSGGYTELSRPSAVVGKHILAISVLNWSAASGAFNAAILRDTGTRYMVYGTPGVTITNLELRWVYQD